MAAMSCCSAPPARERARCRQLSHVRSHGNGTRRLMRPGQSTALGRLRATRVTTAAPGVFWARFGPFCGALRDILRIYGFEGDARGQGEVFTRNSESNRCRNCSQCK